MTHLPSEWRSRLNGVARLVLAGGLMLGIALGVQVLGAGPARAACGPLSGAPPSSLLTAPVYVVVNSGANVRNAPTVNGCVIVLESSGTDVVAVPDSNGNIQTVNADGYTWLKIAYYQFSCRTCSNIDWSHEGWAAMVNLKSAKTGPVLCNPGPGGGAPCLVFSDLPPNTGPPSHGATSCPPSYSCPTTPVGQYYSDTSVVAYASDPNWFIHHFGNGVGNNFYWGYDWYLEPQP